MDHCRGGCCRGAIELRSVLWSEASGTAQPALPRRSGKIRVADDRVSVLNCIALNRFPFFQDSRASPAPRPLRQPREHADRDPAVRVPGEARGFLRLRELARRGRRRGHVGEDAPRGRERPSQTP